MLNLNEKIKKFFSRKSEIENKLSHSQDLESEKLTELSKELSDIVIVTDLATELEKKRNEIRDLEQLSKDKNSEFELIEMAKSESKSLEDEVKMVRDQAPSEVSSSTPRYIG